MSNHITYLFGAGASAQSMPIVSEINGQISALATSLANANKIGRFGNPYFGTLVKDTVDDATKESNLLYDVDHDLLGGKILTEEIVNTIDRHIHRFNQFSTIDTYAKYLVLRGQDNHLSELKSIVDLYFSIRHFAARNSGLQATVKRGDTEKLLSDYDNRYDSLMATLLQKGENNVPALPPNLSFLTWNYDLELELSYSKFFADLTVGGLQRFKKLPNILHINGHATMPDNVDFDWTNYLATLHLSKGNSLGYAFDGTLNQEKEAELQKILEKTTHLVVIGYSFPTFNREIDAQIVRSQDLKRIYIQDKNIEEAKIIKENIISLTKDNSRNIFNSIKPEHVIPMRSANQFYVPTEINDSETFKGVYPIYGGS